MEGQGKRLLLAVALALGVMLIWQKFLSPPKEDDKPKAPIATDGSGGTLVVPASTVGVSTAPPPADATTQSELPLAAEQTITLEFPNRFAATFSSWTGGLVSWKLADPRYERDQTKGELMASFIEKDATGKEQVKRMPMTGAFQVNFARSTYVATFTATAL